MSHAKGQSILKNEVASLKKALVVVVLGRQLVLPFHFLLSIRPQWAHICNVPGTSNSFLIIEPPLVWNTKYLLRLLRGFKKKALCVHVLDLTKVRTQYMCDGLAKPTKVDNKWTTLMITLSDRNHSFLLSFSVFVLDRKPN